jgi:multiple sugar transport system permease protein
MRVKKKNQNKEGLYYIFPAILVLGLTSIIPMAYSALMSFFNWDWGSRMDFVGLENYLFYLTDPSFWQVIWQTCYFTVGAVIIEVVLGFLVAFVLHNLTVGQGIYRSLLMIPLMFSGIIVALISKVLLDPTLGIVNYFLATLNLPTSVWFGDANSAMASIILVDTWWRTPFVIIIISAALQSLPVEPFEAADIDGANGLNKFLYLTLPMLKPVLLTVIVFRTIDCLKVFEIIYGTTGGGPNQVTESIQTLAYRTAFKFQQMSRSMTLMIIFSVVILLLTIIYLKFVNKERESKDNAKI